MNRNDLVVGTVQGTSFFLSPMAAGNRPFPGIFFCQLFFLNSRIRRVKIFEIRFRVTSFYFDFLVSSSGG